jgi:creatinine amidohydrolase
MGLGVDTYCSYLMCKLVRHDLEAKKIKTLIAPPFYWGINNATGSFSGSFTVRKETMKNVLYDIFVSLKRWGITYVFNINWHGDHEHNVTILEAVKEARIDTGIRAYCVLGDYHAKRFGLSGKEAHVILWRNSKTTKPPSGGLEIHADMTETSVMAHYFPDQVNVELTKTLKSTNLTFDDLLVWRQGWSDARKVTPLGYFGDPASFDPMVGKQLMEDDARNLAHLIETFLKGDYKVPEI